MTQVAKDFAPVLAKITTNLIPAPCITAYGKICELERNLRAEIQCEKTCDAIVASSTPANTLLRVAVDGAHNGFDHVVCYPSYERLMCLAREHSWEHDEIHLETDHVGQATARSSIFGSNDPNKIRQ